MPILSFRLLVTHVYATWSNRLLHFVSKDTPNIDLTRKYLQLGDIKNTRRYKKSD